MTSTTISMSPSGQLFLEIPNSHGDLCQINLAEGQVEKILKLLLRAQRAQPAIGKSAGPTWRLMLEENLLEALARHPVRKIAEGQTREARPSKTEATPAELGL